MGGGTIGLIMKVELCHFGSGHNVLIQLHGHRLDFRSRKRSTSVNDDDDDDELELKGKLSFAKLSS
jgi:UDP-N-acetylenolpyruvoylglucosamine reductase